MTISATTGGAGPAAVRAGDQQLTRAVAQRDARAQQQLADRLVRRVRRIAHTLMNGLIDADDAAQHALIEILRSAHTYRGEQSLERWADAIAGRSVVRFARAVRRRNPQLSSTLDDSRAPEAGEAPKPADTTPRTLEDYLSTMPAVRREVLFLRHALGHGVEQIAEITQASPSMVRERLMAARRELRMRPSRDRLMYKDSDTASSERWAAIRDRDALGELLTDKELLELEELERTDPIARSFATEERELSGYLDAASPNRLLVSNLVIERETVEHVLSAVRVTSQPLGVRDPDADLASAIDPEGPGWVRSASLGLSGLLALVAVIALAMFEPRSSGPAGHVAGNPQPALSPTVEALTTAHTHQRGGRLRRSNKLLAPGEVVSAGETLSAGEKPGCIVVEPASVVCLAPGAEVHVRSLALSAAVIQVNRGRVVATHDNARGSFELNVGSVHVRSEHGVFGLELSDNEQTIRVRVLDGSAAVESPFGKSHPTRMQMAVLRTTDRTSVVESLPEGQAQREWELRAVGALEFRR